MENPTSHPFLAFNYLKYLSTSIFALIFIAWLSSISSCQDDIKVTDPAPGQRSGEPIKTISMDSIAVNTEDVDKVRTNDLTQYLTGIYFDTVFGKVKANLFAGFDIPDDGFSETFLDNRSNNIDSAVLLLPYNDEQDFMGNPGNTQTWNLHELNEQIKTGDNASYSSNSTFKYANSPLTKRVGSFRPNKKEILRVNLSGDFIDKFENASSGDLKGSGSFRSFFNGLAIIPQDNINNNRKGSVLTWELEDEDAGIVFYHNDGVKDTIRITDNSGTVNTFNLDKTKSLAGSEFNDKYGFVQPMGGLKLTLRFPSDQLKSLIDDGKVTVHKATINIPASKSYHKDIRPSQSLFLFNEDQADIRFLDTAQYRSNTSRFLFNNPTYFQRLLNSYADNEEPMLSGLTIAAPNDQIANNLPYSPNPVLVPKANNKKEKGVTLKLIYSNVTEQ